MAGILKTYLELAVQWDLTHKSDEKLVHEIFCFLKTKHNWEENHIQVKTATNMGFSGTVPIFDIWILRQYLKDNHPDYFYAV